MSTTAVSPRVFTASAARVVPCTRHAWHVVLRADANVWQFHAGQAVMIARHGHQPRRPYSIASAPGDLARDGTIEFLVAVGPEGQPGEHLAGLQAGDLVDVEGPAGRFTLPTPGPRAHLVFFAGGTGVAPLRSMWRQAAIDAPDSQVTIVYSARTQGHLAFADELASIDRADAARVVITLTREPEASDWTGRRGRVDAALIDGLVDAARSHAFVCGPPAFVEHVVARLRDAGVSPDRVHQEGW